MTQLQLKKLNRFSKPGPVVLLIMDGVGIGEPNQHNAVYMANTPCLDRLMGSKLYTQLKAHGTAVGMPSDADMGNSEVGHNALGSGQVFDQGAALVNRAIQSGDLFQGPVWKAIMQRQKGLGTLGLSQNESGKAFGEKIPEFTESKRGHSFEMRTGARKAFRRVESKERHLGYDRREYLRTQAPHGTFCDRPTLHLIGLLSDGNVHSHMNHIKALIQQAVADGVRRIRLHTLLDGRDVLGRSALTYIADIENFARPLNAAAADIQIASGGGRMLLTMDRYNAQWDMVERGWRTHVLADAPVFQSATQAVESAYQTPDLIDQYIPAFVVDNGQGSLSPILDGDSVICFNFRGDRAIELTLAFEDPDFKIFDRKRVPEVLYAGMMQYDGDLKLPKHYLVSPPQLTGVLSEYLAAEGLRSFAISETQKYGHVTYFWNGNRSSYINQDLETYIEIPSDTIPFDQRPEMKAKEIADKTIELLKTGQFDWGWVNFPNGDMVGHTGVFDAVVKSVEVTDESVQRIIDVVMDLNGVVIVLADHGNADEMFQKQADQWVPKTAHTLNPVPCAIVDSRGDQWYQMAALHQPGLANVAATICNLLGYEAPAHFEASLIELR